MGIMAYQASLFFLLSTVCSVAYSQTQLYSIEDLNILQKEHNYKEFLEHAHDIRPSKRTKDWKTNIFKMTQGYLTDITSKNDYTRESFKFTENISKWSSLKENELFQLKKTKYSLRYLENCFYNTSHISICQKDLERFWSSSAKYVERPDISFRLGTLMAPYIIKNKIWKYFKIAANSKLSIFYCKKTIVQKVILDQIMKKIDLSNKNASKKLSNLVNFDCWDKVVPQIKLWLTSTSRTKSQYAYILLESLSKLTQTEKDTYLTRYLLQDPSVGEIFNIAWTNIKMVGQNYSRRIAVINALKTFDPLPGATFSTSNEKKRDILLDLIFKSIPEYFDYYGEVCYQYLSGTKSFPNGNPTVECRELVKASKRKKWMSPHILQKFNKLPILI